jgi:hypothetical protein
MALGDGDTWDETVPSNATNLSDGDDYIRDVRKGIRIRMEYEHSTFGASSAGGKHKFVTLQTQATKPTVDATQTAAVYAKDVGSGVIELFYEDEAGNEIQITSGSGLSGIIAAASQAETEAASSTTVSATPGRMQYHPGVAKAWGMFDGQTAGSHAVTVGHNVTSVNRTAEGTWTVTLTTAFSTANYAVICTGTRVGGTGNIGISVTSKSTTSFVITAYNSVDVARDVQDLSFTCFGDQ